MIAFKFKSVNTCEDKKMRQIVPVLKECLDKFDIKLSRLVLSVPQSFS